MKSSILILFFISVCGICFSQKEWFTVYSDSTALVTDGNAITKQFIADVKKINPALKFEVTTVLNTTPYLIYFDPTGAVKTANLPIWSQVIPEQQQFFYEVAGGQEAGKNAFGYFFNGFYLPHELAHALQDAYEGEVAGSYDNEYFANVVAFLWWKKQGRDQELKLCYESAKTMWSHLKNPVPDGMTIQEYFTKNYEQASSNPYEYGYMQFMQFMMIYEDQSLPSFDEFVKRYLKG